MNAVKIVKVNPSFWTVKGRESEIGINVSPWRTGERGRRYTLTTYRAFNRTTFVELAEADTLAKLAERLGKKLAAQAVVS